MNAREISELLRRRIVADIHLGRLKPGDRLPSLRTIGNELGVSIRAAARAYMELQEEGLVTVRGRSGIYLVLPHVADISLEPPLDWYAEVLKEAWSRGISLKDLRDNLDQLVANPLRAACVESTADHMEAFCSELAEKFALETVSVTLTASGARIGDREMTLPEAIADCDFVVTTAFHAADVHAAANVVNKPVVMISMNEALVTLLERELIAERFDPDSGLTLLTVEEMTANRAAMNGTKTLLTRAARKRLKEEEYHFEPVAFLSAQAVRKLVQVMLAVQQKRAMQLA